MVITVLFVKKSEVYYVSTSVAALARRSGFHRNTLLRGRALAGNKGGIYETDNYTISKALFFRGLPRGDPRFLVRLRKSL